MKGGAPLQASDLRAAIIHYLQSRWSINKAKGNLAQVQFIENIYGKKTRGKYYRPGCWLLAPQTEEYYKNRVAVFVHNRIESENALKNEITPNIETVASYLRNAGIQTIYAIPTYACEDKTTNAQTCFLIKLKNKQKGTLQEIFETELSWVFYVFKQKDPKWSRIAPKKFFSKWPRGGRPSRNNKEWDAYVKRQYQELSEDILLELALHEAFYSGLIKTQLKLKIHDPYDVDGFIVTKDNEVIPLELKEKTPAYDKSLRKKYFGIDAGRILMLLRLVIPNDGNALYVVREMKESDKSAPRKFLEWKYTTLADIILSASWNLQGGGKGMTGGRTQTVKLPYKIFKKMDFDLVFSGNFPIGSISEEMKHQIAEILKE
ncbi:hypothetical protein [Palaeococcus sp. (in: euryarchaeotes)]